MIQKLVEVKYRKEQDSFLRLIMQENRLRASLRQLDLHLEQSRECQDVELKAIGADVVWQAWGGRKKRELNISQVRKSYGKVLVSDALFDDACKKTNKK